MNVAVYSGSFDPVTFEDLDLIKRGSGLFDQIIVAVLNNADLHPLFTINERMQLLTRVTQQLANVRVQSYDGLLINFMKREEAHIILRGLRTVSDFARDLQMTRANNSLTYSIESCFMIIDSRYTFLSSSVVKEIVKYGGMVSAFVPAEVNRVLEQKFNPTCISQQRMTEGSSGGNDYVSIFS
ncbi:MAG: pantetheine-phosphate adenylyltransferase [Sporolactobacillus sp.]